MVCYVMDMLHEAMSLADGYDKIYDTDVVAVTKYLAFKKVLSFSCI